MPHLRSRLAAALRGAVFLPGVVLSGIVLPGLAQAALLHDPTTGEAVVLAEAPSNSTLGAYLAGQVAEIAYPERVAVENQLPAELALIKIERTAAGDAPADADTGRLAGVEIEFVRQGLMAADQHAGRELQEADRVGNIAGLVGIDQHLVEGDLVAARPHSGVDDSKFLAHDYPPVFPF